MVQTGPNSQLGGENDGLFNNAYQVGMELIVKTVPIAPADWAKTIEKISFGHDLILNIISLYQKEYNSVNEQVCVTCWGEIRLRIRKV